MAYNVSVKAVGASTELVVDNWTIASGIVCKVYNGTTWDTATVKVYNGTSWDTATPKVYNGSAWNG